MRVASQGGMVGRLYEWPATAGDPPRQRQVWPGGVWRVVARWASLPGVRVVRNVMVRNVETGELAIRPWYPAPRRVAMCPECCEVPALNGGRCFGCRGRSML